MPNENESKNVVYYESELPK